MNFRFLTRLFKRIDIPASMFSTALEEGARDAFKEKGWSGGETNNENKTGGCNSKNNDSMKHPKK